MTNTTTNKAKVNEPIKASVAAISLENPIGEISPYPKVVKVTTEKYKELKKFIIFVPKVLEIEKDVNSPAFCIPTKKKRIAEVRIINKEKKITLIGFSPL